MLKLVKKAQIFSANEKHQGHISGHLHLLHQRVDCLHRKSSFLFFFFWLEKDTVKVKVSMHTLTHILLPLPPLSTHFPPSERKNPSTKLFTQRQHPNCVRRPASNSKSLLHATRLYLWYMSTSLRSNIHCDSSSVEGKTVAALSFCFAAGTLKCIKFPFVELRSVFSPVVAD